MRHHALPSASLVSLASILSFACSNGAAPPSLDAGSSHASSVGSSSASNGGSSSQGASASKGSSASGASGSGSSVAASSTSAAGTFSYSPKGCAYTVTPPSALMYAATALDDDASAGAMGTPERVRLGLGGDTTAGQPGYADPTTTAAFTWETAAANTAAKVRFGTSAASLTTVQTGYVWTLPATATAGASYMHEVHVCGLTPDTTYYYQVGGGASGAEVWSATQSFTTQGASGAVTLGVYGDARDSSTTWQLVNEHLKALDVSALLFSGDLVLSGGTESEYNDWLDAIWKDPKNAGQFLTLGETLFLPVAGNHEYILDATADHFSSAFAIPGSGPYAKSFGSYDIGLAHIIYIDDEAIANDTAGTTSAQADAQLAWLKADLTAANADRTKHPFVIAMSHRGLFSTSNHAADPDVLQARSTLAPIYAQYNVDLVLNGHDHEYERTVPIAPGSPVTGDPVAKAGGTTYVICAGAGADPYLIGTGTQSWRAQKVAFGSAATGTAASYLGVYQTLKLDPATTSLTVTVYALTMGGTDPVVDTFTLKH